MNLTKWIKRISVFSIIIAGLLIYGNPIYAQHASGENTYKQLLAFAEKGDNAYINKLNSTPRSLDWESAEISSR